MSIMNIWEPRSHHLASLGDENSIVFKWLVVIDFRAFEKGFKLPLEFDHFAEDTRPLELDGYALIDLSNKGGMDQ